jgi:hypothetical protein
MVAKKPATKTDTKLFFIFLFRLNNKLAWGRRG